MTPRSISWAPLLASVAASALLLPPTPALAQQKVGAATAVNPEATGVPPGGAVRQIVIGQDVVHNERITTSTAGQTQITFLDQSSMMLGPDADLTIDNFVFDPTTSSGQLAMSATKGVFRYVGGALSHAGAVTINTPAGELGIRGGTVVGSLTASGQLSLVLLFGEAWVQPNCPGCAPRLITRPGFFVSIAGPGQPASSPGPAPAGFILQLMALLDGRSGRTGGSPVSPTDTGLLGSGLPGTLGDPATNDLAALHHLPPFTPPPTFNPSTIQTTLGVGSAFSHGHTVTVNQNRPTSPPPPPPPLPPLPPPGPGP
jgi:hypothetical protein